MLAGGAASGVKWLRWKYFGDLEVFTLVAVAGSFSAAGRRLMLAPFSVARIVDRIEARLGVRLLPRTTRLLTITSEGTAYLSAARRVLVDLRETEQMISDRSSPRGRLRVTTSIQYGRLSLVPLLGEFIRRYPDIVLDVNLTDNVVDIAAGQADVGILFGPLPDGVMQTIFPHTSFTVTPSAVLIPSRPPIGHFRPF
jgi:DNA-binding transcriptional LysR family regulator